MSSKAAELPQLIKRLVEVRDNPSNCESRGTQNLHANREATITTAVTIAVTAKEPVGNSAVNAPAIRRPTNSNPTAPSMSKIAKRVVAISC